MSVIAWIILLHVNDINNCLFNIHSLSIPHNDTAQSTKYHMCTCLCLYVTVFFCLYAPRSIGGGGYFFSLSVCMPFCLPQSFNIYYNTDGGTSIYCLQISRISLSSSLRPHGQRSMSSWPKIANINIIIMYTCFYSKLT